MGVAAYGVVSSRREPDAMLHECDWEVYEKGVTSRTFRSLPHLLYHLERVLRMQAPLAEVYLLRAISPVFRERIMLVTAMANSCII
jgi:hypothetical protein